MSNLVSFIGSENDGLVVGNEGMRRAKGKVRELQARQGKV